MLHFSMEGENERARHVGKFETNASPTGVGRYWYR